MLGALLLAGNGIVDEFPSLAPVLRAGALLAYLLPAIYGRNQPNARFIFLLNLFLGWTIIGWIFALNLALNVSPADKEAAASSRPGRLKNNPHS